MKCKNCGHDEKFHHDSDIRRLSNMLAEKGECAEPKRSQIKKCKICKEVIECEEHGKEYIDEYQHEDGSWYYSCCKCVIECGSAFGSIVHHCGGIISLDRNVKSQTIIIDDKGNIVEVKSDI